MKLAFWKRRRSRRDSPTASETGHDPAFGDANANADADGDADAATAQLLRIRTRRRLIGACAILLCVIVIVPMVLDPTPRAVPDNIPIDLPSDKTPFAPKLAPPPEVSAPAAADSGTAAPAAPGSAPDGAAPSDVAPAPAAPAPDAAKGETHHGKHKTDAAAAPGKIFVQAAAMSKESSARELAERLSKSGLSPFVERSGPGDGALFRVRVGPFATRADAEHSRERLRELGVKSNIVGAG